MAACHPLSVNVVWSLPFALWMLQGYVMTIPRDLEEAGSVDGAGRIRILVSIVFPLLLPGIIATSMFTFIASWNEFFFALVLIQDPDLNTLPRTDRLAEFAARDCNSLFRLASARVSPDLTRALPRS